MIRASTVFMALASAVAAAALGFSFQDASAGGGGGRSGITEECGEQVCNVNMTRSTFAPDVLKVRPGATVAWTNTDKMVHTVTSGSPVGRGEIGVLFDSGLASPIGEGQRWEHRFDAPGTFDYFCQVHPRMAAQVVVAGDPIQEFPQATSLVAIAGIAVASAIAGIQLKRRRA